jgi:hypothetical protein
MAVDSHRRIVALADVVRRYGAVVQSLVGAVGEEVLNIDDAEIRARLESALRCANGQLAAAEDALDHALTSLPEGRPPG